MANFAPFALQTPSQALRFDPDSQALTLVDNATGQRLLFTPGTACCRPVLEGVAIELVLVGVECDGTEAILRYGGEGVADFVLRISASGTDDCLDFSCEFTALAATQLNRLELLPAGTAITAYDVVNFRNRHLTPATWPELLLGGEGCRTDTYSGDWQFAPHPSLLIFRKLESSLFAGAFDLPESTFGMYLSVRDYRVDTWHLDYGEEPWGKPLAAGKRFVSPRLRLFVRQGLSVYEMLDVFRDMLIHGGQIPDPADKQRHSWWREPLYCTWMDQGQASQRLAPAEPQDQTAATAPPPPVRVMTEELVREAVAIIKRERLPFRTIILDEGWEVARGQWEPDPVRFPDLRRLVDDLHADGLKVLVWWNWAEIAAEAEVDPAHLVECGVPSKHGQRLRDYSLPATQEEYLRPLFHRLLAPDPGCYDLDGVKTDFLADKVHADMLVHDPSWRGEENYFRRVTELFYTEMKRQKPDAMHLGCAGHFWLAPWQDLNRTYDVHNSDYRAHEERARMLQHTCPGCPVSYDLPWLENLEHWFASARAVGASVEIGNLLWVQDDSFSSPRPADAAYWELLRKCLGTAAFPPTSTGR